MSVNPIWHIGEWDGTPDGFLNADKIHKMHPSDSRMDAWGPITFAAGSDNDSKFPMAMFRGANDGIKVTFDLTEAQAGQDRKLKIGVTLSRVSAGVGIKVNDFQTESFETLAIKTRGVTRGVTLGNYKLYEFAIPSSALVAGSNTMTLSIATASLDPPQKYLSASVVFDALELV
ncbi:hypothetical protein PR003_g17855 [Phytophthora rubi]|uniref:Rhamnogalacturonan lyase domain-containing protein n=1 Tax=Phytophthora rubi TaxID=129364 RepID=A0A6A3J6B7_9STRA|nr:hypothetical protein PR002_g22171 [Phytophthora rubi]KAE8990287.1 hypothetical protein PR001_g21533 [Phytophthora rubi]KAE9319903.1 hypothetical protein PR003_g17855 [Phytophthora rubi]